MEKNVFKEITNRLYKCYRQGNKGNFRVQGNGYDFKIFVSENMTINLLESKDDFNVIKKICDAIPYLYYIRHNGLFNESKRT